MEKVVLDVPTLWADHHVLKIRDVLATLKGIEDVYASSAWKQVLVSFDPAKLEPAIIEKTLAEAGYPVGEEGPSVLTLPTKNRQDPKWKETGPRKTVTN